MSMRNSILAAGLLAQTPRNIPVFDISPIVDALDEAILDLGIDIASDAIVGAIVSEIVADTRLEKLNVTSAVGGKAKIIITTASFIAKLGTIEIKLRRVLYAFSMASRYANTAIQLQQLANQRASELWDAINAGEVVDSISGGFVGDGESIKISDDIGVDDALRLQLVAQAYQNRAEEAAQLGTDLGVDTGAWGPLLNLTGFGDLAVFFLTVADALLEKEELDQLNARLALVIEHSLYWNIEVIYDAAGFHLSSFCAPDVLSDWSSARVNEGSSITYDLSLNSPPETEATIAVSSDNPDVTVSPTLLTFTSSNWNKPQTVTVSVAEDADREDEVAVLSHEITGYGSIPTRISYIRIIDSRRNRSPVAEGEVSVRPLVEGGSAATEDVSPYFSDPDNDRLTYSAQSSNTHVATVRVSGSEVTITPRDEGSTTITITATDPGGLTAMQTAGVTVQSDRGCEYTLLESSQKVLANGGSLDVYVTTTSGCAWRATTDSDFLSVRPSRGTGSGTVTVTVAANTRSRSRTGRLTIAGERFTVEQEGVRTIASQDLSRGDAVIVQNTLNDGLNVRSEARIPPPPEDRNSNRIGQVFDGATGIIRGGSRTANGFRWWEVEWDDSHQVVWRPGKRPRDNEGWSVESTALGVYLHRRPPDLAIESFKVNNRNVIDRRGEFTDFTLDPGEAFTLSLTVRNVGYNSSEATDLGYYHTSTPARDSGDDLTMVGTDPVRGLNPNRTSDESIRVKAPLTPGTYYYAAAVIASDDLNPVNNLVPDKAKVTVLEPTFPDLVIVEGSTKVRPYTLAPGSEFRLYATVQNEGEGRSSSTTLRYYRSSDPNISTSEAAVGTDDVHALSSDVTSEEWKTLNAPSEAGIYYYGACVDSVRDENDTGNNCSEGVPLTVISPDLIVENVRVSPNTVTAGEPFAVSARVRNQNTGLSVNTTLRYYRSADSTISIDDIPVGTGGVYLSDNGTSDESETVTAPSEARTYYYGACVDSVRGESKTGNNCSDGIPVVVLEPRNRAPEAVGMVPPQTLTVGGSPASVDVSAHFRDLDNDHLTYTVTSNNTSVATVSAFYAIVTITPQNAGSATVAVTASDGILTAIQEITVTVEAAPQQNQTPETVGTIRAQTLTVGGSAGSVDVSSYFRDPDNDSLTYTAISDNTSVATVSVADALVTLTPQNAGSATVTVTASDGTLTAIQEISVTVEAAPQQNRAPESVGTVPPQTLTVGGSAANVDVSSNFRDLDNDSLTYTAISDNTSAVTVSVSGATVTIKPQNQGSATITVTASDGTLTATHRISVTVEAAPRVSRPMYWTGGDNTIRRGTLEGTHAQVLIDSDGTPVDIVLDILGNKMYWTDRGDRLIQRANLDGSGVVSLVTNLGSPRGIALDVSGGKMYWTDSDTDKIQRANLNGSRVEDLVTGLGSPMRIALDVSGGKMYWTDSGTDKIQRANLNGSGVQDLVTGLVSPRGIALDISGGKMYWIDDSTKKIQRANLNGSGVEDLVTGSDIGGSDIELDVSGGKMYWAGNTFDKIQRANLDGSQIEVLVTGDYPRGVALAIIQEEVVNRAPLTVGTISTQTLTVGGSAGSVDVSSNFRDPDNDRLTYTATSDNTKVAIVSVSNTVVTITPKDVGSATVAVTASDGTLTATQRITVTVEAAPRTVQTLVKISGDNQQGVPGTTLTSPFVVEVWDAAGNPLGGIIVTFAVTAGGGSLSAQNSTTDVSGRASTTLTLGPNAGTNTVEASVSVIATSLRFTAIAQARVGEARDIPDPNLRAAIEKVLGKASGETITATEMATLTRFTARNVNIRDLTGLERATNLVELGLDGKHVDDIWVNSNSISNISPLSGLTGLERLWLGGNSISDISPLAGLTNLTWLTLEFNNISDISPLSGLTNLTELVIFHNSISDISPLSSLTNLTKLRLEQNLISSVSPLSGLTNLTELRLRDNNITDLSPLVANTGLGTGDRVDVRGNPLNSLSVHTHIPALQSRGVTVNFENDVNRAPESVGTIPAQPLTVGGSTARVNVSSNFRDPDNDNLTYTATSDNTSVVTVSVSDATVTLTPQRTGSATVTVTANDGTLTATQRIAVTVEAAPRVAYTLEIISGDNQQGAPGATLLSPLVVEVRDTENRGLGGVDVTFTVTAGGGSLSETRVTTDANGQASSRLTLGNNEGENTVRVSAEGVAQTVSFTAVGANEVNIPDPNLRAKIERALNKRAGDPITAVDMTTLTRLDASRSSISDLTGLKFAINLTELNLYENAIRILPTSVFEGLAKVTSLRLRSNPLQTIETGAFKGLNSLTILDLAYMQLATIEGGAFNGLANLQSLSLYGNKLTTLPTSMFEGLSQVTSLDLRSNPLQTVKTGAFNGLSSLTELDLSAVRSTRGRIIGGGQLTTIEGGAFKGLSNLTELNLYENAIRILPTSVFEGLAKVTSLRLRSNPLQTIETGAFKGLNSLTILDLAYMQLATIEGGAFNGLANLQSLSLYGNKLTTLPTSMFEGLSQVTSLDLRSNPLQTVKTGAFNGLSSLTELDLSAVRSTRGRIIGGGQLTTIEGGAFKGLSNLTELNLYENAIRILPTSVFEGLSSLKWLSLNSNPGTPFILTLELARTDTTDLAAPGPATVVAQLAQGAPFEMTVNLSVEGGTLSGNTATIARGEIQSDPITLTQSGTRPATVSFETVPRVPSDYYGIRLAVGDSLSTGSISPHALVKISGDNQQGGPGATLEESLIVEVRDATDRGLGGVDVTFAVTAGDGSLGETTVTTDADGQAESWFTLGGQPGTHTVQASVEGLSQTAVFNATIESIEFDFSVPSGGIHYIHVPLKVTAVNGVDQTIESISDLYDALGGGDAVNFLITYDSQVQDWLSYFGSSDRDTPADRVLTDDMGIIAGMKAAVSVLLRGIALGTDGGSTINLNQGLNLVGIPLRDERITRVSDLFQVNGIGGNVPVIIVTDGGDFKSVGRSGDPGDISITGGQGFLLTAQQEATVTISGEAWTNTSATAAPPSLSLKYIEGRDTTPVLALRGAVIDEETGLNKLGFRVTVKNLSAGRAAAVVTAPDEAGYRLIFVDIEKARAATIGDTLEISAQSPNPSIGVRPLQYRVTAEDVRQSLIQLPELVAYEIPAETQLLANYPNPFNPETWIPYRLAEDADVTLTIYDLSGRVVRAIDVGHRIAAVYESRSKAIYWDGRNEFGEQAASGVFFYHLSAGDFSATRKMIILK